ncbi:hypothetical protein D9758_011579 [Tetrapyrgos nigripes]|uniref:F-box domain-containing protein n=1 Tax=Tetrapyrgos nigripes TaxID=182062 RepID=A0A8H5CQR9_9AGAR|nr:hypothetical protein D9758_011579 [Tetrapyrgos nigripes]
MNLLAVPVELTLSIIAHLPIPSIHALQRVCKQLNDFVCANESQIYHTAASYHTWIPSTALSFDEITSVHSARSIYGVQDWKSFCQRHFQIERSWSGRDFSSLSPFTATENEVHRIKVDEKAGIIITTVQNGGIRVVDIVENKLLWSLPREYVKQYAHCEYDQGFLIFDRMDRGKEVWILVSSCHSDLPSDEEAKYPPQPDQVAASGQAASLHADTDKGHFRPWALFRMPRVTRAFRFVYPTLLVGSSNQFFLWDIPSRDLVQTISVNPDQLQQHTPITHFGITQLNYVEVSEQHVVVCNISSLLVYARSNGRLVLQLPSDRFTYGSRMYVLRDKVDPPPGINTMMVNHPLRERIPAEPPAPNRRYLDEFVAAHVSRCGRHLVAMLATSKLVFIKDFQRGDDDLNERMFQLNLGSSRAGSRYLAFERNKIAVATNNGVFILNLKQALEDGHSPLEINVSRVPALFNNLLLSSISCLQLGETGLYFNWNAEVLQSDPTENERQFSISLRSSARHARLQTGDYMVMLDPDLPFTSSISTVCSVNMVSTPNDVQTQKNASDELINV